MTDRQSFNNIEKNMAIIVDKDKKRRDIAVACTELLLEKGLKNLRVAEIATAAGIGKGTVYDYFENKEAVVFEIIRHLIQEHREDLKARSNENTSCREKVFYLFDFFLCEFKDYKKHLEVYREFTAATLSSNDKTMMAFNDECTVFLKAILVDIIKQGIKKEELNPKSEYLAAGIMGAERGLMLTGWMEAVDNRNIFIKYINTLFDLIEIKK